MTTAFKRIDWSSLDAAGKTAALARPAQRTAGDVTEVVRAIMESAAAPVLNLSVPLIADAGTGANWAEAH